MAGAVARGTTIARNILDCDDCRCTIDAFRQMGIDITQRGAQTVIRGKGLNGLQKPALPLSMGNSGTSMRILAGILAGQAFESTLTAGEQLAKRPMKRVVEPLALMGVDIAARDNAYPPLIVRGGRVKPISYRTPVPSAQIKSAVLFAGLYADGVTRVEEEYASRDHTERTLSLFGADITISHNAVEVRGGRELSAQKIVIPADISSASFFMVGALLIKGSKLTMQGVGTNPTRAGIIDAIKRMGGQVSVTNTKELFEPIGDIEIVSGNTRGVEIGKNEIPSLIDELPVLFVLASLSKGRTVIRGLAELKVKETNRIASMAYNLNAMGARMAVGEDEVVIEGVSSLTHARLKSFGDHRTCMACAIAALTVDGGCEIDETDCVSKSFPEFFTRLRALAE